LTLGVGVTLTLGVGLAPGVYVTLGVTEGVTVGVGVTLELGYGFPPVKPVHRVSTIPSHVSVIFSQ
jgi:hypothetical protein